MIWIIDGRSGSGKTTLAEQLSAQFEIPVVHMDDLYPGWDGLAAGSEYATRMVLAPLASGSSARWQRWDWHADARAEWQSLAAGSSLILEGCGSLSRANRRLADHAIWLECDAATRKERAVARDGDESWWERWQVQEDAFITRENPASLADEIRSC